MAYIRNFAGQILAQTAGTDLRDFAGRTLFRIDGQNIRSFAGQTLYKLDGYVPKIVLIAFLMNL